MYGSPILINLLCWPTTASTCIGVKSYPVINVDDKQTYQSVDGFGFALTGGSAMHIIRMNAESRAKLLHELFATDGDNIGVSYLRVSIGSSDLNEHVFSYDDLPQEKLIRLWKSLILARTG